MNNFLGLSEKKGRQICPKILVQQSLDAVRIFLFLLTKIFLHLHGDLDN